MSFRVAVYFLFLPCLLKSQEEKVQLDFNQFNRWTIEVKFQKFNYLSGRIRSEGNFLIYTTDKGVWTSPINRHILYHRNGRIKSVSNYSQKGLPLNDSLYRRNGRLKKVRVYNTTS
jgi:hypothetical protein